MRARVCVFVCVGREAALVSWLLKPLCPGMHSQVMAQYEGRIGCHFFVFFFRDGTVSVHTFCLIPLTFHFFFFLYSIFTLSCGYSGTFVTPHVKYWGRGNSSWVCPNSNLTFFFFKKILPLSSVDAIGGCVGATPLHRFLFCVFVLSLNFTFFYFCFFHLPRLPQIMPAHDSLHITTLVPPAVVRQLSSV